MKDKLPDVPGVYTIYNKISGERYIGSSLNVRRRCRFHESKLRSEKHTNAKLQHAWNKHGAGAFVFVLLERLGQNQCVLAMREQEYMNASRPEYNITLEALVNHRESIKKALAVKKASGVQLGNRTNLDEARKNATKTIKRSAVDFAEKVAPIIKKIHEAGNTSHSACARSLNALGIRTARGGQWHATSVRRVLEKSREGEKSVI